MKKGRSLILAVGLLAASSLSLPAQTSTNVITTTTVTNVLTVMVTNVITVTNVVIIVPPSTPPAKAEGLKPPSRYPWESSISAGFTLTRGNSHTLLYEGEIRTARKTPKNEYSLGAGGAYGSQDSQENVNNYHGFGQWNHLFTKKLYDYVRVEAKRDVIADLECRVNIGPGIGYYLIKETNTTFAVEAGAGYQYEHLDGSYNYFATMRLADRFEHKFNERVRVWQDMEWLPQVDEVDNYVVNFEIGVETSLTKSFSLKTYLDDSFATQPAAGRQKNDLKIVSGIAYKF